MGTLSIAMSWDDWLTLIQNFLLLSAVAMGGPLVLLPEMRRLLVSTHGWLTDEQVSASVVIAQAAPGPNVLFVALLGWNVGLNNGSYGWAFFGAAALMIAMLLPSSLMIFATARWIHKNGHKPGVRAFKQGMSPIVVALLIASGWTLATAGTSSLGDWPLWAVTAVTTGLVLWGKIHMFWLLAIGAFLGATGLLSAA
jgi:chromate transporter